MIKAHDICKEFVKVGFGPRRAAPTEKCCLLQSCHSGVARPGVFSSEEGVQWGNEIKSVTNLKEDPRTSKRNPQSRSWKPGAEPKNESEEMP